MRALGQIGSALLPRVPARGPTAAADVTPGFLTRHLAASHPGAAVQQVTPVGGTTGTTDRRRISVEWNDAGRAAGLPEALFVKSTPLSARNRTMVAALDMAVNEVRFYRTAAVELADLVPRAWFTSAGVGARHLLVLDDLVAAGATPYALGAFDTDAQVDHARALMDTFARLHALFWTSRRLREDLSFAKRWSRRPGYRVLRRFYRWGRRGALRLDRPEVTPPVRRLRVALDTNADAYYREFESGPLTFLHGDSHVGDTYRLADGRAGLLDWQVVWQGPGLREVSYCLTTGLDVEVRRSHEQELVGRYLERLGALGVREVPGFERAMDRYRLFAGEAWDAAAMTMAWPGLQTEANAAAAWRRACQAVEDHDTASLIERL